MLACPKCASDLVLTSQPVVEDDDIVTGALSCSSCVAKYAVDNGIPRFVDADNYATSFGLQWNTFRTEQLDSVNGLDLSARRFWSETEWPGDWLKGKWLLDAGCGAGRFLDVLEGYDCDIVGVDLSNAVDAVRASLGDRPNVHLVQASIYELPFRRASFDGCYSIGVVQHTPDPTRTLRTLPTFVKDGGRFSVTAYERRRWTHLYSKYLLRRLTTRMDPARLLLSIRCAMPVLFPLTEVTFRLPVVRRLFRFLIPVANYTGTQPALSLKARYRWAMMDTFDMLTPAFDTPQRYDDVVATLDDVGVDIRRTAPKGLCLTGTVHPSGQLSDVAVSDA